MAYAYYRLLAYVKGWRVHWQHGTAQSIDPPLPSYVEGMQATRLHMTHRRHQTRAALVFGAGREAQVLALQAALRHR